MMRIKRISTDQNRDCEEKKPLTVVEGDKNGTQMIRIKRIGTDQNRDCEEKKPLTIVEGDKNGTQIKSNR